MSRARDARHKDRRQQAAAVVSPADRLRASKGRKLGLIIPVLATAAVIAAIAILGVGGGGSSKAQIAQEVGDLLAGIPQNGNTLGSPQSPMALQIFADLECPTVKLFVENYLPSIINTWVRAGELKLVFRSLKTDTANEHVFFRQEVAALAAGKQDKMWNFALTFVHEQGQHFSAYATTDFLTGIASQVPGISQTKWRTAQSSSLLMKQVALGVRAAHARGMRSTPSFLFSFRKATGASSARSASLDNEFLTSFKRDVEALKLEATKDAPTVGLFNVL